MFRKVCFPAFISLLIILFYPVPLVSATEKETEIPRIGTHISKSYKANKICLDCHGSAIYEFTNSLTGKVQKRKMPPMHVINISTFYQGVHAGMKCWHCHSPDYETFPHNSSLRLEPLEGCLDCHGEEQKSPIEGYENIEKEFKESTHYKNAIDFTCWKCHEPHTDIIHIRALNKSVRSIVAEDNKVCMRCHSNMEEFKLMTDRDEIDIMKTHDWLPNQSLHFKSVRCIECHTRQGDQPIVNHKILRKKESVKKCAECHSKNSLLVDSLYKQRVRQDRLKKRGFLNAAILNEAYVIGANQNEYLNFLSIAIFILVLVGIIIHIILRIIVANRVQ